MIIALRYFFDNRGVPLEDYNSRYSTTARKVAASIEICPSYDNAVYTDLEVTIPMSELHLGRNRYETLQVQVFVWDYSQPQHKELFRSSIIKFRYTSY